MSSANNQEACLDNNRNSNHPVLQVEVYLGNQLAAAVSLANLRSQLEEVYSVVEPCNPLVLAVDFSTASQLEACLMAEDKPLEILSLRNPSSLV